MTLVDYVLYFVWLLFPAFFFGMALWGLLERISRRNVKDDLPFYAKQGFFTLFAVLLALWIDRSFLAGIHEAVITPFLDFIPLGFSRVLLFPLVLIALAMIVGPSRLARVEKIARVGGGNPRRKETQLSWTKKGKKK